MVPGNERTGHQARTRRTGAMLKLGLTAIAILGIGGALTSAMWTQIADFQATASRAAFGFEVRVDGGAWTQSNGGDFDIPLDDPRLLGMTAVTGQIFFQVEVRNHGDLPIYLNATVTQADIIGLLVGADLAPNTAVQPDESHTFPIWIDANSLPGFIQGQTGTFSVRLAGSQSPVVSAP